VSPEVGVVSCSESANFRGLNCFPAFLAMAVIACTYLALPKRYHLKPDWEETAVYVMIPLVIVTVGFRSLWRDTAFWVAVIFASAIQWALSMLDPASRRTGSGCWKGGCAAGLPIVCRDLRVYQAIAAELLR